jgi:hypothetical protein
MQASISITRERLGRLFFRRCFYLFVTLLPLIALEPYIEAIRGGLRVNYMINALVMLAASTVSQ